MDIKQVGWYWVYSDKYPLKKVRKILFDVRNKTHHYSEPKTMAMDKTTFYGCLFFAVVIAIGPLAASIMMLYK